MANSALSDYWDADAIAGLESDLLATKRCADAGTFFPAQAAARGGIGVLVSTGSARGALKRLPQAAKSCKSMTSTQNLGSSFLAASSRSSTTHSQSTARPYTAGSTLRSSQRAGQPLDVSGLAAAAAASAVLGAGAGVPDVARHEWERVVPHPSDFVSTARQTRVCDVRPASKWASISFYESDPSEVKRHLDIVEMVDQTHAEGKMMERRDENVRHFTWAVQQRETFRRQRQEVAERYSRSGLPQRKAYSARPAMSTQYAASATLTGRLGSTVSTDAGSDQGSAVLAGSRGSSGYQLAISLPKKTYVNVYQRMAAEARDALEDSLEVSRRRAAAAAKKKEADELKGQLADMDGFESHLQEVHRARGRHQYSAAASQEQVLDDFDE